MCRSDSKPVPCWGSNPPSSAMKKKALDRVRLASFNSRVSLKHKYMAMTVAKNGCSTAKRAIHAFETGETIALNHLSQVHGADKDLRFHNLSDKQLRTVLTSEEFYRFGFVRNPYTRFMSAWKQKVWGSDYAYRWLRPGIMEMCGSATPEDFLYYIENHEHHWVRVDQHWAEQWGQLVTEHISYDKLVRFESFNEDFASVLRRLEAPEAVLALGVTKTNQTPVGGAVGVYDERLAEKVYNHYSRDFDEFQYDPESWHV